MIGMTATTTMKALSVSLALVVAASTAGTAVGFQFQFQSHQKHSSVAAAAKSLVTGGAQQPAFVRGSSPEKTTSTMLSAASTASGEDRVLDTEAIAKYAGAIVLQMGLITGFLTGIDALVGALPFEIPFGANVFLFFGLALKSRAFNPLSNERPQRETTEIKGAEKRKMPEWMPPGVVFPIVWILLIGPLRATSSALLVASGASYASPAILALMLHLSIGDTWNTINNLERRYGTSVVGVACVWISAAFAAYQYGLVDATAGKLLSLPLIWLTIASSLIVRTWQLNPGADGTKESFLPTKPEGQEGSITKLVWFEGANEE